VARWEPNARERFVHAAVDLFAEQGYDATTVNEIRSRYPFIRDLVREHAATRQRDEAAEGVASFREKRAARWYPGRA